MFDLSQPPHEAGPKLGQPGPVGARPGPLPSRGHGGAIVQVPRVPATSQMPRFRSWLTSKSLYSRFC